MALVWLAVQQELSNVYIQDVSLKHALGRENSIKHSGNDVTKTFKLTFDCIENNEASFVCAQHL